jgi:hypothetical protein
MRDGDTAFGGWLADIGANLLCVVLILLVLLSLAPALPRDAAERPLGLPLVRSAPVSGVEGVRLLSRLVIPPEGHLVLALGPDGARLRISTEESAPIAPGALPASAPAATLHVFDPTHYAATVAALRARAIPFAEITVPDALRAPGDPGHWAPDYVAALEGVRSLTGFRTALRGHLDRKAAGGGAVSKGDDAAARGTGGTLASRFEALRRTINLILLGGGLLFCWLMFRLGRIRAADAADRDALPPRRAPPRSRPVPRG